LWSSVPPAVCNREPVRVGRRRVEAHSYEIPGTRRAALAFSVPHPSGRGFNLKDCRKVVTEMLELARRWR